MNNPQPTPLEKLISDRRRIQQECTIQEQKLNADFSHTRERRHVVTFRCLRSLIP